MTSAPTSRPALRVLFIEDQEDDVALAARELSRAGFALDLHRVETGEQLERSLATSWDVIIADYSLPSFDASSALEMVRRKGIVVPVVVVSGSIGEDAAVAVMRAGAVDVVSKRALSRLPRVVERELGDLSARRAGAEALAALRLTERRLETVLASAPVALYQLALPDRRCEWMSDSILRLTGFPASSFIEESEFLWRRIHPDDMAAAADFRRDASPSCALEYRFRVASGDYRWFLATETASTTADGEHRVGSLLDIDDRKRDEQRQRDVHLELESRVAQRTAALAALNEDLRGQIVERQRAVDERKAVELQLQSAKEAAEAANRAKSEFLATMSHELRTPLNAILGFGELLEDAAFGPINARQRKFVENILGAGRHLLVLINDVLDLAKVEAGRMELVYTRFAVADAAMDASTVIAVAARQKGVNVAVRPTETPIIIHADHGKVRQILYNLLSNALKFTPEGGKIEVKFELRAGEAHTDLLVSVADTGIGIAEENFARIFQPFEQIDSTYARSQTGTGLGLPVARRLVELHGGRMWVESTAGVGSTFYFTLPLQQRRMSSRSHRRMDVR